MVVIQPRFYSVKTAFSLTESPLRVEHCHITHPLTLYILIKIYCTLTNTILYQIYGQINVIGKQYIISRMCQVWNF